MGDLFVSVADLEFDAEWTGDNATIRDELRANMPISGDAARWGDELYFSVPFTVDPTTLQQAVEPGVLAYWPDGPAICLFWRPTPASVDETPMAASPVAPFARISSPERLAGVTGGASIQLTPGGTS